VQASGAAPFGQLPILQQGGFTVGQTCAIVNYIAKMAGTAFEGEGTCTAFDGWHCM
jgi:glutathione S-transferase